MWNQDMDEVYKPTDVKSAYDPGCVCLFCAKNVPLEKTEEAFAKHEPNCEWVKHTRTDWEHWGKDGRK